VPIYSITPPTPGPVTRLFARHVLRTALRRPCLSNKQQPCHSDQSESEAESESESNFDMCAQRYFGSSYRSAPVQGVRLQPCEQGSAAEALFSMLVHFDRVETEMVLVPGTGKDSGGGEGVTVTVDLPLLMRHGAHVESLSACVAHGIDDGPWEERCWRTGPLDRGWAHVDTPSVSRGVQSYVYRPA